MAAPQEKSQQPGTGELTLEDIDRVAELMFEQAKDPEEEEKQPSRPNSRTGKPTKRKASAPKTRTSERLASTGKEVSACDSSIEPIEQAVPPLTFKPQVTKPLLAPQAPQKVVKQKKKTATVIVPETIPEIPSVESVLSLDADGTLDDLISAAGDLVNPSGPQSIADMSPDNEEEDPDGVDLEKGSCYDQLEARVKDLVEKLDNFSSILTVEPFAAIHNVFKQSGYKNMAEAVGTLNVEPYVATEAFMSYVRGSHVELTPQLKSEFKKMSPPPTKKKKLV